MVPLVKRTLGTHHIKGIFLFNNMESLAQGFSMMIGNRFGFILLQIRISSNKRFKAEPGLEIFMV